MAKVSSPAFPGRAVRTVPAAHTPLAWLTLALALLFVFFFLLLIFLRMPFPGYTLMSYQDMIDLFMPLVLIPVYWLLFKRVAHQETGVTGEIAFMALAGLWAMGHGMHLAANSINNLIGHLAEGGVIDVSGTGIFTLTYFIDEHLSHYLWHAGIVGMAGLLIFGAWVRPSEERTAWGIVAPGAALYGLTQAIIFLEAQTVPLGLAFVALVSLLVLLWGLRKLSHQPVLAFFGIACLLSLALLVGWGIAYGGFPEPTAVLPFL